MNHLQAKDAIRLKQYMQKAIDRSQFFIGYPIAQDFDYSELYPLLALPLKSEATSPQFPGPGRICSAAIEQHRV